jgi:hypothetical protein
VQYAKYTKDIVRKFKMEDSKAMSTPMSMTTALDADEEGEHMDQKEYQSIQFSVCLCADFQASPRTSHRQAVKRIFKYLRHTPDFGLWYPASSSLALQGFSDADFAECRLDRKSTSETCHFLDLLRCLGVAANSRVLLNPLPRQSTLPLLVFALSSFGSPTL